MLDAFVTVIVDPILPATPTPPPLPTPTPAPTPNPKPQADVLIRNAGDITYAGNNIYNTTGSQQTSHQSTTPTVTTIYNVQVQNDSSLPAVFTVTGSAGGSGWTVQYYDALTGGNNITSQVTGIGGWPTPALQANQACFLRLEVTPDNTVPQCGAKTVTVSAATHVGLGADTVMAATTCVQALPLAPSDTYAISTGSGKVTIYWGAVTGATGYNIYRGTIAGGENYSAPVNGATPVTMLSYPGGSTYMFTDTGLTNGTEYFYTVKAVQDCAEGTASNEDSDMADPNSIPWDTRNPSQILAAAVNVANSSMPDNETPIDIGDEFAMVGPDGAIYERGVNTQEPPFGNYTDDGTGYILDDGSTIALADISSEPPPSANSMRVRPALPKARPLPSQRRPTTHYGTHPIGTRAIPDPEPWPYRGARTDVGYDAAMFDIELGPVNLTNPSCYRSR